MRAKRILLASTALTPLVFAGGAMADAVSYPNATIGAFAGGMYSNTLILGEGRFTLPVGMAWGTQVDGYIGTVGGTLYAQVAAHYFWRDPANALFGMYGAWTHWQNADSFRIGPEVELYLNNITLSGVGGWRFDNNGGGGVFAQVKGQLYLNPNTKLYAGYIYEGTSFGNVGFEHLFQNSGLSVFGEGRFSQQTAAAWIGFRYYMGNGEQTKSLMERERQDVAPMWLHITDQVVPTTPAPTTTATTTTTTTTTTTSTSTSTSTSTTTSTSTSTTSLPPLS